MSDPNVFIVKPGYIEGDFKSPWIEYDAQTTIAAVKEVLRQKLGIPADVQDLRFGDVQLDDDKTLDFYDIEVGTTLVLQLHTGVFDYDLARLTLEPNLVESGASGSKCAHIAPGTGIRQVIRNLASGGCYLKFSTSGDLTFTVTFQSSDGETLRVVEGTVGLQPGSVSDDAVETADTSMATYEIQVDAPAGTRSAVLSFRVESGRGVLLDDVTFRGRTRTRNDGPDVDEEPSLPSTT